jgi:hypothetical protein
MRATPRRGDARFSERINQSSPILDRTPLVEALRARLRRVDLIGWAQITARAEDLGRSFEDLRLLLALAVMDGACSVSDLARLSGLPLDAAYRAIHNLNGQGAQPCGTARRRISFLRFASPPTVFVVGASEAAPCGSAIPREARDERTPSRRGLPSTYCP